MLWFVTLVEGHPVIKGSYAGRVLRGVVDFAGQDLCEALPRVTLLPPPIACRLATNSLRLW
jgi:hypothetical protein